MQTVLMEKTHVFHAKNPTLNPTIDKLNLKIPLGFKARFESSSSFYSTCRTSKNSQHAKLLN